ncbi:phosphoglycolate phosphatase [Geothrix limicola]|uniref:Phosphoglycolate phosphatase n=1 Tax=Geothrix limicola TaxID=2927978 RepID=A0ABQ5QIE3_9BACT|nr:HAD hydrolase-like protein [Geothrix limicola]GLH74634.1 phosphoglycolate phosphatase [Geothrix limicola]
MESQETAPGVVCFDLDGTLVDPLLGVRNCLLKTCDAFGLDLPDEATIRSWIGFGMRESLATLPGLEDPARLEDALDFYWDRYREDGVFEHELYPGVFHLLHRLKRQGHRIYIVSAKPSLFARRIAYQFDLNLIFDDIFGSTLKGRWQPKTEVLGGLVKQGTVRPGGVFIGDRGVDMVAARDHGLEAIGVGWGYGTREELLAAGAEHLFDTVPELDAWLRIRFPQPERFDAFSRSE